MFYYNNNSKPFQNGEAFLFKTKSHKPETTNHK